MRSASWAISLLWVIITRVWWNFWLVVFRSPSTSALVLLSRLPVGSSAKTIAGFDTKARAMATRCCWPPERLLGILFSLSSSPSICTTSFINFLSTLFPSSSTGRWAHPIRRSCSAAWIYHCRRFLR